MTETSDKVSRLLALVPYVLSQGVASIPQTAAEFGISPDQLRRELEMLWLCGRSSGPEDLIDLMFDGDTVSVTYDGGLSRPLKLTSIEAMTLAVALRTLTQLPDVAPGGAAQRALEKIERAAGRHLDTDSVDIRLAEQDRWVILARQAVAQQRAVRLRYYTATRDASTERTVDPVQVFTADGINYLEAWCRSAVGIRIFRLDRVEQASMLDEPAVVPAEVIASDLSRGVYRPAPEHLLVELSLGAGWHWISEYYPCETVTTSGPELIITLRVADPSWVSALVRRSGGEVRALAPTGLAGTVAQEIAAALAAYGMQPLSGRPSDPERE